MTNDLLEDCQSCYRAYEVLVPVLYQEFVWDSEGNRNVYEANRYYCYKCLSKDREAVKNRPVNQGG